MAGFNYHSDSALSVGLIRGHRRVHRPRRRYNYRSAPLTMTHPHNLLPPSSVEENTMIFDDVTTVQGRFHHPIHHYNPLPISSVDHENTLIFDGVAAQERFRHGDHHHQQQRYLVMPVSSYMEEADVMIFDGEDLVQERLFQHSRPPTTNDNDHRLDQQRTTGRDGAARLSEEEISKCVGLKKNVTSHGDNDEGICVICQENLCFEEEEDDDGGNKIIGVISSCGHEFHFDCVAKWLQLKNLCPLCKAKAY